jgi:hypothetical protein
MVPGFDVKAVRVSMGLRHGYFVASRNEGVCINYMASSSSKYAR